MSKIHGAALAAALACLSPAPASALTATCTVTPTPDGFVALRERPTASSRLLHRVRPGETVSLMTFADGAEIAGNWRRVEVLPGESFASAPPGEFRMVDGRPTFSRHAEADRRRVKSGWMHARYLDECG